MYAARINDLIKKGLLTEAQAREMIQDNENLSLSTESAAQPERQAARQQKSGSEAGAAQASGDGKTQKKPTKADLAKWKEELAGDVEFVKDIRAAYAKAGRKAKSVDDFEDMVAEIMYPKYGEMDIAGYTDKGGKKTVYKDPNPFREEATRVHERVHEQSIKAGIAKYGKETPAYDKWYYNPKRWAADEVKAYTADLKYMERVLRRLNR
jgi:hypothetical protein